MAEWSIEKQRTASGHYWICAEVRVPYYTLRTQKEVMQRFSLYWTGQEWVDHAQYDRRKRFAPAEVDHERMNPRPEAKLREYIETFYGPGTAGE